MKPTLAICINTHNAERYVDNLFKNIFTLDQFDKNFIKVYVYDDKSTDDTNKILENLSKTFDFKYIKGEENLGILKARNYMIKSVHEDYLIFIDDDDSFDNNVLIDFYKNYKEHDVMILKRKYIYFNEEIVRDDIYDQDPNSSKVQKFYINTFMNYITGIFISKEIYQNEYFILKVKENINYYEDIILYAFLIYFSKSPKYLSTYYNYNRRNTNSLIWKKNKEIEYYTCCILLEYFNEQIKDFTFSTDLFYINLVFNIRMLIMIYRDKTKEDEKSYKTLLERYFKKDNIKKYKLVKSDRLATWVLKSNFIGFLYKNFYLKLKIDKK